MKFLRFLFHLFAIAFLTILTQIGGLLYLIALLVYRRKKLMRYVFFFGIYLVATYLIVPYVAPLFGRERIRTSPGVEAHSYFYVLENRNYVKPELNTALSKVGEQFSKKYPGSKIHFLDANFPFFDKFPLLPHLSHNDGKKLDISLVYEDNGELTNKRPTVSGYGAFESPLASEHNQIKKCKARGNWQYDYPKYLTLGTINSELQFSEKGNKALLKMIAANPQIGKIFIEPHLKYRMGLTHSKIRYHGCQAVRHDDHIHLQLK